MNKTDILIIGAGAAGLMAAKILSAHGKKVLILEARERTGGRINSFQTEKGLQILEAGAEFIHGNLPLTRKVLTEAKINMRPAGGRMVNLRSKNKFPEPPPEHWQLLDTYLENSKEDISVHDFITKYFSEEKYTAISNTILGFVEGYDTADAHYASTFAFRDEWSQIGGEPQYRVDGGYIAMTDFLAGEIINLGGTIRLNTVVKKINHQQQNITAVCSDGKVYTADKCILTIPAGIMKADVSHPAFITFDPPLPEIQSAFENIGFGNIIKIIVTCNDLFWEKEKYQMQKMGFLFADAEIPTWWTQFPDTAPVLTGWLAGPRAHAVRYKSDTEIKSIAMDSLAHIFALTQDDLKKMIRDCKIINWSADIFSNGSYAYTTVNGNDSIAFLKNGIGSKLFFAGDAIYSGHSVGTVEAALTSAVEVTDRLLQQV